MAITEGGTEQRPRSARAVFLVLLAAALVGSAVVALAVTRDVLTGREAPVSIPADDCGEIPAVEPDGADVPPGVAVLNVTRVLPIPTMKGLVGAIMIHRNEYSSPGEYLHYTSVPRAGAVRKALIANGFRSGASVGYESEPITFAATALQLGSPERAATFQRQVLLDGCRNGVVGHVVPLDGGPRGYLFDARATGPLVQRATFLVGDSVVYLGLCVCDEYPDAHPYDLLRIWAANVDQRFRVPPPR